MLKTIVAVERDGIDVRILVLNFDVPSREFNLDAAVCAASTEYCQTEEGRKTYGGNCNCFNWADFDAYVPDEICKKQGFGKVSSEVASEIVNWDEQLVDEEDIFSDGDVD